MRFAGYGGESKPMDRLLHMREETRVEKIRARTSTPFGKVFQCVSKVSTS